MKAVEGAPRSALTAWHRSQWELQMASTNSGLQPTISLDELLSESTTVRCDDTGVAFIWKGTVSCGSACEEKAVRLMPARQHEHCPYFM